MPVKNWFVAFNHNGTNIETVVEAYTADGAINAAAMCYRESFGRLPHEEEILKVEETAIVPTTPNP